jgi:hypothetical protein
MVLGAEYSSLSYIGGCLGGLTHLSFICHKTIGGVKTGRGMVIYKECKYLTIYILPMKPFLRILTPPPETERLLLT